MSEPVLVSFNVPPTPDMDFVKSLPPTDTPEDLEDLAKFKEVLEKECPAALKHPYFHDQVLFLFLLARRRDFVKATQMVANSLAWRLENGIDDLLEKYNPPKYLNRLYLPGGTFGLDKDNDPVIWSRMGNVDPSGIVNGFPPEIIQKIAAWRQELIVRRLNDLSVSQKRAVRRVFVVTDLANLGLRHCVPAAFSLLGSVIRIQEDHYPERLKTHVIIRAPSVFQYAWGIVSKYLDERTRKKFVFAGSDYLSVLREYIADENIPAMYGGALSVNGDPECRSCIPAGGVMPPEHILADRLAIDDKVNVYVRAGGSHEHHFEASEPGKLHWSFQTEAHDIQFSIKQGTAVVHDSSRVHASSSMVVGNMQVDSPGKFTLVFDNSFSWVKGKQLSYRVWLDRTAEGQMDISLSELSLEGAATAATSTNSFSETMAAI